MSIQTNTSSQTSIFYILLGMLFGAALVGLGLWLSAGQNLETLAHIWQPLIQRVTLTQRVIAFLPVETNAALATQGQLMGLPLSEHSQAYWFVARAGGFVAYLLLWLATGWGVVMSSKFAKGRIEATLVYGLHEYLPLLATVFMVIHSLALLGDSYIDFKLWHLIIPFSTSYEPLWTGLGTLAFLLSLSLIISTYVKNRIGRKLWRVIHTGAYLAFLFAFVHGIMAGSDTHLVAVKLMYLLTGATIFFLTYYRLFTYQPKRRLRPHPSKHHQC